MLVTKSMIFRKKNFATIGDVTRSPASREFQINSPKIWKFLAMCVFYLPKLASE